MNEGKIELEAHPDLTGKLHLHSLGLSCRLLYGLTLELLPSVDVVLVLKGLHGLERKLLTSQCAMWVAMLATSHMGMTQWLRKLGMRFNFGFRWAVPASWTGSPGTLCSFS